MKLNRNSNRSSALLPVFAGVVLAGTASSEAVILAAWDDWADTTSAYAPDTSETGFTSSVTTAENRINSGFGSTDGSFGTFAGAGTSLSGLLVREQNGGLTVTVSLANNTGQSYLIDSFHFDFGARILSPDSFTLTYTTGGLGASNTLIDTQTGLTRIVGASQGVSEGDYADFDYDLSTSLTDTTLADGESAEFVLVFSGQTSATGSSIVDNIAIHGTAIPEPSALTLLGLVGAFGLLRRSRR